jgi:hypothetical protein
METKDKNNEEETIEAAETEKLAPAIPQIPAKLKKIPAFPNANMFNK